jgi:hypothetical protein
MSYHRRLDAVIAQYYEKVPKKKVFSKDGTVLPGVVWYSSVTQEAMSLLNKSCIHAWEIYSEWGLRPRCILYYWDSRTGIMRKVVAVENTIPYAICKAIYKVLKLNNKRLKLT